MGAGETQPPFLYIGMLFTTQGLVKVIYNTELNENLTLDQIFSADSAFNVSGVADLRQALLVTEEYYANLAKLNVKEVDQTQVFDKLWLERTGQRSYSRSLKMPIFARQDRPSRKRAEAGETTEKPTTFHFSTIILYRENYYPAVGDLIYFRDAMFELTNVYLDPTDYFQQTAFPLYVRAESRISNQDSKNFGNPCADKFGLTDPGAAVTALPIGAKSQVMP